METKILLQIAYAIAKFKDFVTEDLTDEDFQELDLETPPTEEEMKEVLKHYNGWGMDSIEDKMRNLYFSN